MLNPDYRDILFAFSSEEVEFLVVGAFALAAHGLPRATGDIDLWVRPTHENAARVYRALGVFGAPLNGLSVEDFAEEDIVFQIGVVPRRIDILTSITGVAFDDAWADRLQLDIGGLPLAVLSRRHLVVNKRKTGRPKDVLDADWIEGEGLPPEG